MTAACQRCQHRHVDRLTMANGEVWLTCRRCGWARTSRGGQCIYAAATAHVRDWQRLTGRAS